MFAGPPARAGEPLYVIEQLVVGVNSAPGGAGSRIGTLRSGDRVELLERQGDEAQIQLPGGTSGWVKGSYLSSELPLQRRLQDRTAEVEKLKQDVSRLESQLAARTAVRPGAGSTSAPRAAGAAPAAATGTAPTAVAGARTSTVGTTGAASAAAVGAAPTGATGTAPTAAAGAPTSTIGATGAASTSSVGPSGTAAATSPSSEAATATPDGAQHSPSSPAGPPPLSGDPPPYLGPTDPAAEPPWVWILTCSACALAVGFVAGWRVLDRRIRRKYGGLRIY